MEVEEEEQYQLKDLLALVTESNIHSEILSGEAVGNEVC